MTRKQSRQNKDSEYYHEGLETEESDFVYSELCESEIQLHTENTTTEASGESDSDEEIVDSPFSCGYCRNKAPNCIMRCRICNKFFCNSRTGSGPSHLVLHMNCSHHFALAFHPDSSFGDSELKCSSSNCKEDNPFSLYITKNSRSKQSLAGSNKNKNDEKKINKDQPIENDSLRSEMSLPDSNNIKIFCRDHCQPGAVSLIENKMIEQSVVMQEIPQIYENFVVMVTDLEIEILEKKWASGMDAEVEELKAYSSSLKQEKVRMRYLSRTHYRDTFLSLVELEKESEKRMFSLLNRNETEVYIKSKGEFSFSIFDKEVSGLEYLKSKIKPGDRLIIYPFEMENSTESSNKNKKTANGIRCQILNIGGKNVLYCRPLAQMKNDSQYESPQKIVDRIVGKTGGRYSFKAKIVYLFGKTVHERCQACLEDFVRDPQMSRTVEHVILGKLNETPKFEAEHAIGKKSSVKYLTQLNEYQTRALFNTLNSPFSLIQGPPGTGKTTVSANIIYNFVLDSRRRKLGWVLVCAPSNIAVDHLMEKCKGGKFKTLRIYSRARESKDYSDSLHGKVAKKIWERFTANSAPKKSSSVKKRKVPKSLYDICNSLKSIKGEARRIEEICDIVFYSNCQELKKFVFTIEKEIIRDHEVVMTTCVTAGREIMKKFSFNYLLVDEAGQATEPELLIPLMNGAKQVVLVGDHYQLGPVIMDRTAARSGFNQSLFERLTKIGIKPHILKNQYRMHPSLAQYPNSAFYNGFLTSEVKPEERVLDNLSGFFPDETIPMYFERIEGKEEISSNGTSYFNRQEAVRVTQTVLDLITRGIPADKIGIITPYEGQRRFLSELFEKEGLLPEEEFKSLEIASVDSFQGREKDLIIISCVRSNDFKNIGFLKDYRRLNVTITRAKYGNIILGNPELLATNDLWKSLIGFCEIRKILVDSNKESLSKRYTDIEDENKLYEEVKKLIEIKRFDSKKGESYKNYYSSDVNIDHESMLETASETEAMSEFEGTEHNLNESTSAQSETDTLKNIEFEY